MALNQTAGELTAMTEMQGRLPQLLQQAIAEKFASSPLYQQREVAFKNYMDAVPKARTDMATMVNQPGGPILSPSQQGQVINAKEAAATAPLTSLNDLLSMQAGGAQGLAKAGTDLYSAMLQAKQQQYGNELDMAKLNQSGSGGSLSDRLALYKLFAPTATQENSAINAQSALSDLKNLETLSKSGLTRFRSQLPLGIGRVFSPATQQFQDNARNIMDVITRSRTGAALNINEQKFYEEYVPKWTDSKATIDSKLKRLNDVYSAVLLEGRKPLELLLGGEAGLPYFMENLSLNTGENDGFRPDGM